MTVHRSHLQGSIESFMQSNVMSVSLETPLREVSALLDRHNFSSVPVLEDERVVGVVSRTDLLRLGRREGAGHGAPLAPLPARSAGEVATRPAAVVSPGESLMHVAGMMIERRIHRVFVAQEGKLVGVFSTLDLLRAIAHSRVELQLAEVMSKPAFTLPVASTVAHATDRLAHAHVSGLCIVDEEGWPVGLFSQREALAASHLPGESSVEEAMSYALVCLHGQVPLYRAASLAASSRARRVLVIEQRHVVGVVTPLDFARAVSH